MNRLLDFRPRQRLLGVFLLLPLLMVGTGCSGSGAGTLPAAEQSSTATASFSLSIEESSASPASRPGVRSAFSFGPTSSSGVSALAFSVADITRVRIDVKEKDTGALIYENFDLLKVDNTWSGKLPFLPKGKPVTFVARALDASGTALFSGTTDQTLSGDLETVIIRLEAFNDGQAIALPRITRITIPDAFPQGKRGNISFSVSATTGEKLSYVINGAAGGGTFLPQKGNLSLLATAATFVSQYAPPSVSAETEFTHEVVVTNAAGHSVRTTFKTRVVPVVQDDVVDPIIVVQFNPVINALAAHRPVGTSEVLWKATVVDDAPLAELKYKWSFTPNGTFSPAPDFADLGATNPARMVNYTPALQGELKLSVTDAQGGETTLTYALTPDQFPTDFYEVGDLKGLQSISSGAHHTCVLMDNEYVRCWGDGAYGQLGYASTQDIGDNEHPHQAGSVTLVGKAIQVVTGANHTCALLDSGFVRCWGRNSFGQLGYANTDNIGDGEPVSSQGYVSLGGRATRLTAGLHHTCALLTTGKVRCWGRNNHGQLGYGNTISVGDSQPVWKAGDVDLSPSVGVSVKDVVAGGYHTCALFSSGAVRCWGQAAYGQLGNGNTTQIGDNEVPSTGEVNVGGPVKQLTAGGYHTCALLETGKVRCWGYSNHGQLGYPAFSGSSNVGDNETPASAGDVNVGDTVLQVVASKNDDTATDHTCALLSSGGVKCWGYNGNGELGLGHTTNLPQPNATPINLGDTSAYALSAGGVHTCVLLSTGKPRCWGANSNGQLGYSHTTPIGDNELPTTGEVKVSGP